MGCIGMSKVSRDKGARYERYIANILKDYGYDAHRSVQYCGRTGQAPDVVGLPHIHIECKHYANRAFDYDWIDQAKRDSKENEIPAVFHKTDYHEDLVTLRLSDFMQIYREYEASMDLLERFGNGER